MAESAAFRARKGGEWLKTASVAAVTLDNTGKPVGFGVEMMDASLQNKNTKNFGENFQPVGGHVHVLVVVLEEITYQLHPPMSLGGTAAGAKWDFQNPLNIGSLASAVRDHYKNWKLGDTSKGGHPLFGCLGGPGTGKSRVLDEFPSIVQKHTFNQEEDGGKEDPEMMKLLAGAFTFNVSYENGSRTPFSFTHAGQAIGTRMMYQLQNKLSWQSFVANNSRYHNPAQVLEKLQSLFKPEDGVGLEQSKMCIFLCDGMQELSHSSGDHASEFYTALGSLSDLVNASKCFVIAMCSATIYEPLHDFLSVSPQWTYEVPTAVLSRPKLNGVDVFQPFDVNPLTQLLIDDMGGHGRALEVLYKTLSDQGIRPFAFDPVITEVSSALRVQYPSIVTEMESMVHAFMAVIARRDVNCYSLFGKLTLDGVISTGLIRLVGNHLECPYVLYLLLDSNKYPLSNYHSCAPQGMEEGVVPWETWEIYNCKYRVLEAIACGDGEVVPWKQLHFGARFGPGCDHFVRERPRKYELYTKQMQTKTKGFTKERCPCGFDPTLSYVFQPAAGSSFGDAWLCDEEVDKGFFHEVHQYKRVESGISSKVFVEDKNKAAGPDDIFMLFCAGDVKVDLGKLYNCAVVDKACWKEYYGPFAERALFMSTIPSSIIRQQLVKTIDPQKSSRIVRKLPYQSNENTQTKKRSTMAFLTRCR